MVVGTDGSDDRIHVGAKTGEVHHGLHSTNASNRSPSFGLVRIGKIHYLLISSFYLTQELLFDKNRGSGGSSSPLFFILSGKLKNSKAKNERKNRRTTD